MAETDASAQPAQFDQFRQNKAAASASPTFFFSPRLAGGSASLRLVTRHVRALRWIMRFDPVMRGLVTIVDDSAAERQCRKAKIPEKYSGDSYFPLRIDRRRIRQRGPS